MAPNLLLPKCAAALLALATILSGFAPVDRFTWGLELTALGAVGVLVLIARSRGFTPSPPTAWLLWVYAFVMLVGAHWTYGQAPPGEWLQGVLNLQRNPWDRIGHLFQGALPALAMFEWRGNRLHAFLAGLSTCLFFEAAEHIATFFTQGDFIQAQGDRFDSLNDLLFAAIGSIAAVLLVKSKAPTRD